MLITQPFVLWPALFLGILAAAVVSFFRKKRRLAIHGPLVEGLDRPPCRVSRLTEVLAVLIVGLGLFALALTHEPTGGFLAAEKILIAARAKLYWGAATLALLGLGGAAWAAWRGRTRFGVILTTGILAIHALHLNGAKAFYSRKPDEPKSEWKVKFEIADHQYGDAPVEGADLWIGGVHLGKTPMEMTLAEFQNKLGDAPQAPKPEVAMRVGRRVLSWDKNWGVAEENFHPEQNPQVLSASADFAINVPWRESTEKLPDNQTFSGMAKLGDDEIFQAANTSHQTIWRGGYSSVTIRAVLPKRHERIQKLMREIRRADYAVTDAWLAAILAEGDVGKTALFWAARFEPELKSAVRALMDREVENLYGFQPNMPVVAAERLLERVIAEVSGRGEYLSWDTRGVLVERLAETIPAERLAKRLRRFVGPPASEIEAEAKWGYSSYASLSNWRFRAGDLYSSRGENRRWVTSVLAVHAASSGQRAWEKVHGERTSPLQTEFVTELLRWHPKAYDWAQHVGGPVLEEFVIRRYAHDRAEFRRKHGDAIFAESWPIPRFRGRAAERFFARYGADYSVLLTSSRVSPESKELLVRWLNCEPIRALAENRWMVFREGWKLDLTRHPGTCFSYLELLGPSAFERECLPLFDAAVQHCSPRSFPWLPDIIQHFKVLPEAQRIVALKRLRDRSRELAKNDGSDERRRVLGERLPQRATEALANLGDVESIQTLLAVRPLEETPWFRRLASERPPVAVMREMAKHPDAAIRALALPILEEFPIAPFRELLPRIDTRRR